MPDNILYSLHAKTLPSNCFTAPIVSMESFLLFILQIPSEINISYDFVTSSPISFNIFMLSLSIEISELPGIYDETENTAFSIKSPYDKPCASRLSQVYTISSPY